MEATYVPTHDQSNMYVGLIDGAHASKLTAI